MFSVLIVEKWIRIVSPMGWDTKYLMLTLTTLEGFLFKQIKIKICQILHNLLILAKSFKAITFHDPFNNILNALFSSSVPPPQQFAENRLRREKKRGLAKRGFLFHRFKKNDVEHRNGNLISLISSSCVTV